MASSAQKFHNRINLNLLYPQEQSQKFAIKFLKWLLSYGRFIIIVVEIVVLGTFALRFKYDADLASLNEKINEQVPYLESLADDEALIKHTQQRLLAIKTAYSSSPDWQQILIKINNQIPPAVRFTSFNLDSDNTNKAQFKIVASTNSNNDLTLFMSALKTDPYFKNINLTSISYDQGQIVFTITGGTK